MQTLWLILVILGFSVYFIKKSLLSRRNFPRAPFFKLPLIGHLHLVGPSPHKTFFKWREKYGKIFSVQLGHYRTIVINDYKLIKKILADSRFSARVNVPILNLICGEIPSQVTPASSHREFLIHHLDNVSSHSVEIIEEEIQTSLKFFEDHVGQEISLEKIISTLVLNSLTRISSHNHSQDDFFNLITKISENLSQKSLTFTPRLAQKFPKWSGSGWSEHVQTCKELCQHQKNLIAQNKINLNKNNPRDLIDAFLCQQKNCTGEEAENQLVTLLNNFILNGFDPTVNSLLWVILYLASDLDSQLNLQKEIDEVIGQSLPTMEGRRRMPVAISILMESLRLSSFFPIGQFHSANENAHFEGFDIPEGTAICLNLWGVHHDPLVWGHDVSIFKPSRFLSKEYSKLTNVEEIKLQRHEASLPFSFSQGTCPGESLAKEILFLSMTAIFQKFNIYLKTPSLSNSELEPIPGLISKPQPFTVIVKRREKK